VNMTWRVIDAVPMINERQILIEVFDESGASYTKAAAIVRNGATPDEVNAAIGDAVRWTAAEEQRRREAQDSILGLTGAVIIDP
jgi:plastocyanin